MKAVWWLGAGVSKQAGYPLVADFLDPKFFVRWVLREGMRGTMKSHLTKRLIPQVISWSKEGTDLNSLMAQLIRSNDFTRLGELNNFIFDTLNVIRLYHQDFYWLPYMQAFAQFIGSSESSVITFNYDTLVEEQIGHIYVANYLEAKQRADIHNEPYSLGMSENQCFSLSREPRMMDYGSGFISSMLPTSGNLPILKLHGTTCIWYCHLCKSSVYVPPPSQPGISYFYERFRTSGMMECPQCKKETKFDLLFVPPACEEIFPTADLLGFLWSQAEDELMSAQCLVMCGYSLPKEDIKAIDLLRKIGQRNPNLRVLVVDPFFREDARLRLLSILPKSLVLKKTFREFMGLIAAIRAGYNQTILREIGQDIGDFLSMLVNPSASRVNGPLPGSIPLECNLLMLLADNKTSFVHQTAAVTMLGLSNLPEIRDLLKYVAFYERNKTIRGLCAAALGSVADQSSLDALSQLALDTTRYDISQSGSPDAKMQRSIAASARLGILDIALSAPHLNFDKAYIAIAYTYMTDKLDLEQGFARNLLMLLDNIRVFDDDEIANRELKVLIKSIEDNPAMP